MPGREASTKSTLTPTCASITANGGSTQVLTVQAKDANNNNLTAALDRHDHEGIRHRHDLRVTDNSNGTYTATVTAPTTYRLRRPRRYLGFGNPVNPGPPRRPSHRHLHAGPVNATQVDVDADERVDHRQRGRDAGADGPGQGCEQQQPHRRRRRPSRSPSRPAPARSPRSPTTATAPTPRPSRHRRHRLGVFVATLGGKPSRTGPPPDPGHHHLHRRRGDPDRNQLVPASTVAAGASPSQHKPGRHGNAAAVAQNTDIGLAIASTAAVARPGPADRRRSRPARAPSRTPPAQYTKAETITLSATRTSSVTRSTRRPPRRHRPGGGLVRLERS